MEFELSIYGEIIENSRIIYTISFIRAPIIRAAQITIKLTIVTGFTRVRNRNVNTIQRQSLYSMNK